MKPERIQLSRKKGFKLPENTVVVARPSKWGNPFRVGHEAEDQAEAVKMFEASIGGLRRLQIQRLLRGKNLACWCKPGTPCHADVLLKIANP